MRWPIFDSLNLSITSNTKNSPSYSDKTKTKISPLAKFNHPHDDQGIIFNCILDYQFGPQNIIAASKISNNRVVVHLKSASLVDNFI